MNCWSFLLVHCMHHAMHIAVLPSSLLAMRSCTHGSRSHGSVYFLSFSAAFIQMNYDQK